MSDWFVRKSSGFAHVALCCLLGLGILGVNAVWATDATKPPVEQAADGSVTLSATDVTIVGPNARIEGDQEKSIAWWTNVDTTLHWYAKIGKPGKYRVELNFAVFGNGNRGQLSIAAGDQATEAVLMSGNGMNDFKWGQAGELAIGKPGVYPVSATPLKRAHECVTYLRAVVLRPADSPMQAVDITGGPINAAEDGAFKLRASDAEIEGMNAVLEGNDEKNIGFWQDRDTSLRWVIAVWKPGRYRVEMNYALTPSSAGSKLSVLIGDQSVTAKPKPGANWADYKVGQAGDVAITGTGIFPVLVKPLSKPHEMILNLRSVTLASADLPTTAIDIADKPIKQGRGGTLKLTADDAEIDGQVAKLEGGDNKYVVWWGSRESGIAWPVVVEKPGRFNVMVTYSLAGTEASSNVTCSARGRSITGKLPPTNRWDNVKTAKLGMLNIEDKGNVNVVVTSPMEPGLHIMNLRAVELVPARGE